MARRKRRSNNGQALGSIPIEALEAEIQRRQGQVHELLAQHAEHLAAAAELERQIQAIGGQIKRGRGRPRKYPPLGVPKRGPGRPKGSGVGRGRKRGAKPGVKRPRNEQNLVEAMADLLNGRTMNVTTIAEEVQKAGYNTTSPNFRTIVNQTLIKSDRFKKVARGQYTAK